MNLLVQDKFTSTDNNVFNIPFLIKSFCVFPEVYTAKTIKEKFRTTWDFSIDPMWLLNSDGIILGVNNAFCDLFELEEAELIEKHYSICYEIVEKVDIKPSVTTETCYFELSVVTKKGKSIFLEGINNVISSDSTHLQNIVEEPLVFTIFRDISLKKKPHISTPHVKEFELNTEVPTADLTLKESEERYRTLIETSPDAIIMLDVSGVIIMNNKQFCSLMECENVEDVFGKSLAHYIIRRDKRMIANELDEVINAGIKKDIYFKVKTKKKTIPVEMNASLVVDIIGKPSAIICTIRDISDKVKAANALKKSELLFRSVWENSNDGMRLTDSSGRIVEVNKSYCDFVGLTRDELIGKFFYEVFAKGEIEDPDELLKQYKIKFYQNNFNLYVTSRYKYNSGQWIELIESYKIIEADKNSQLLMGIFHNVTEMRKAEEELKNSEKFAAIGKQTAILSHDIKTPLASIKMNIDMLYKGLSLPESNQKSFKIIQKEIKRLVKLLKNVLQYSKDVDPILNPVQLGTLFENIKEFMKPLLDEANAVLVNRVDKEVIINGDYKNLQTVFMHLIENSLESMENGGFIEIYSEESPLYVSIFIKDNGCGITDNEKIFEPFFTTKSTGTGLGLSIAHNILIKHNSEIKLASSKAGETIFEIRFFKK